MHIQTAVGSFGSRLAGALVLALVIAASWQTGAHAQVAALVNGDPVTVLDVTHRMQLTEISTHKQQSREEALNELINEKLKLQIAKRYIINITDRDVDQAFNGMARHAGKARAAASTASFTSSAPAMANSPITSSVLAGLRFGSHCPLSGSRHSPSINNL